MKYTNLVYLISQLYHRGMSDDTERRQQKILQKLLRQTRVEANLRQVDVALKIGKPQPFVSKYESGERRLDLAELRLICKAMNISLEEFVHRFEEAI